MSFNKSDLIKKLSSSFPSFLKKDLTKMVDIILAEAIKSLKNGERVELRDIIMIEAKKYKSRNARNPKTNEVIQVPEKKIVRLKISKKWQELINEKD